MSSVKVQAPFQVSFKGTVYRPGEVCDVPDELARDWLAQGWVTEEKAPRSRREAAVKEGRAEAKERPRDRPRSRK